MAHHVGVDRTDKTLAVFLKRTLQRLASCASKFEFRFRLLVWLYFGSSFRSPSETPFRLHFADGRG